MCGGVTILKTVIVVCLAVLGLIPQSAVGQVTFHGDNAHSGVYRSSEIRDLKSVKWKFKTGAPVIGSPTVSNGVIFIGSVDSSLYAIDQETGRQKWKFETGGGVVSTPAVAKGLVYFGSYDGNFYCVDEGSGSLKWKFAMEYEKRFEAKHLHGQDPKEQIIPDAWDFFMSSPAVADDRVYFGSGDKNVYALNAQTGALVWKFATNDTVHGSPALFENTLYIGSWDSYLYALDATTGKEKWKFKTGEDPINNNQVGLQGSPTIANGTVYIGCRDSHVYAVDSATGRKKWEYSTGNSWVSNTPAVAKGVVYVGTTPLNALDANTGKLLYTMNGDSGGVFSSVALAGDMAYFGDLMGSLYAFDTKTGKRVWEFKTDGSRSDPFKLIGPDGKLNNAAFSPMFNDFEDHYIAMFKRFSLGSILSSPVVDKGNIYFGSTDGFIYALQ